MTGLESWGLPVLAAAAEGDLDCLIRLRVPRGEVEKFREILTRHDIADSVTIAVDDALNPGQSYFQMARREVGLPPLLFTCPRCGKVSAHPKDLEEGYCGACHAWTAT